MNVKDFEYIIEIAKAKSISKAADRLYLSQPTITKFLQRIEAEMQTPLFHRMGKQLVPTAAGVCVIENAQSILNINQEMVNQIQNLLTHKYGNIRLGVPMSRGSFIITLVLPELKRLFPFIKISIELNTTTYLTKRLEQGEYDLIMINYENQKNSLKYYDVGKDEMILAVPPNSSLIEKAEVRADRRYPYLETRHWENEPFILPGNELKSGGYTKNVFAKLNISPPICLEIHNIEQIILAVKHGLGNTIIPSLPMNRDGSEGNPVYLSIENDDPPLMAAVVTQKGKHLSEPEKLLLQLIMENYTKR